MDRAASRIPLLPSPPHAAPFSWRALLLAPWPVPLASSALLASALGGRDFVPMFLLCLAAGLAVSYGGTVVLAACLWLLAWSRPVSLALSTVAGTVLGTIGYLPFLFIDYGASGDNSGPPAESFLSYLLRNWNSPFLWTFVGGGLVTAMIYHALALRFAGRRQPAEPTTSAKT